VWLASYPRSGNTFVRLLLANYFLARFEPVSIHVLKDFSFGEHVQVLWQKVTGAPASARDEKTEWLARDTYFDHLRSTTPPVALRFVKTHTVNCTRWGAPAFNFRESDRVIYVARNPLDVAVSMAAYHGWDMESTISHMLAPFASLAGHPTVGHEVTGSWNLHIQSWLQTKSKQVLFVPYTELLADTEGQLTRILQFISSSQPNPGHIKNVVGWTRFENLKDQEARAGFPERLPGTDQQPFFRSGKVDQWMAALTTAQINRIVNACAPGMELIGLPGAIGSRAKSSRGL